MTALDFFARWRVRIGYPLAVVVLWLSHPVPRSILIGACVGFVGLAIRACAAGYLHKQEVLTTTGPYSHTRNPLYFGSSILVLGAAIAMNAWPSALILIGYFALVYSFVMRREEIELRGHHGAAFDAYAQAVPLFFPRLTPAKVPSSTIAPAQPAALPAAGFSFAQYRKNHEHQAALGFLLLLLVLIIIWRAHVA
ncbi:MAG TPA: isoprenylcysteine carboxylmethyltransferase family protein [Candidatus Eisenbacteria bacterium]|nr:isoprenylcysteine carboxylmethyltransferase family protein [Candidatus Eisenbacteria bacterium]